MGTLALLGKVAVGPFIYIAFTVFIRQLLNFIVLHLRRLNHRSLGVEEDLIFEAVGYLLWNVPEEFFLIKIVYIDLTCVLWVQQLV